MAHSSSGIPSARTQRRFLAWRASMNDEQWVEWGALPDDAWYERVANGLRPRCTREANGGRINPGDSRYGLNV